MAAIKLTPQQHNILKLIYRYRFLTVPHIQYHLHHQYPHRIRTWLKQLHHQQLLYRNYNRQFGADAHPAIYYLHKNAIQILKQDKQVNPKVLSRIYREPQRSQKFINRCLYFADLAIKLDRQAKTNNQTLTYYTKTDLHNFPFMPTPLPDACTVLKSPDKKNSRQLIELFEEGTPRYAIRNRLKQYLEYFLSNTWESTTNYSFPEIILIAGNTSIQRFLNKQIKEIREEESDEIQIIIYNQLNNSFKL